MIRLILEVSEETVNKLADFKEVEKRVEKNPKEVMGELATAVGFSLLNDLTKEKKEHTFVYEDLKTEERRKHRERAFVLATLLLKKEP